MLKTSNVTLKRNQFFTPREGNLGNVLLTSRICLEYFYQWGFQNSSKVMFSTVTLKFDWLQIMNLVYPNLVDTFKWLAFSMQVSWHFLNDTHSVSKMNASYLAHTSPNLQCKVWRRKRKCVSTSSMCVCSFIFYRFF